MLEEKCLLDDLDSNMFARFLVPCQFDLASGASPDGSVENVIADLELTRHSLTFAV
jgi:hypothetical protein